ncbi:MAG: hypothetical protein ACUVRL_01780 [Candidatus Saccharicenans sp.]|uniref:hypothetical protein n=1 Tax=Candidatus Saccharicenans sp. TaxID=2819258 RepID=UPI00404ACA5F
MEQDTQKLTAISAEDLAAVIQELLRTNRPLSTVELAEKLAFAKTASQRNQPVKIYDPYARYEVGDFIYKEYDESLQVGSKVTEHFQGGVVLQVINKINYPSYQCEMLEVDYDGGGPFRKYIDYMKKTRTQVLLPSNLENKALEPATLNQELDPRLTELPLTERDLKTLERNLRKALSSSDSFFGWNDYWQLQAKKPEIAEDKIKEIQAALAGSIRSESTQNLVRQHFNLEPSSDLFELYCLALNHLLEKKYRREFTCLSTSNWGKWHLKSVLNNLPVGLPISAPPVTVPDLGEVEGLQHTRVENFPFKVYLTWREILSGAIRVPRSLSREFDSREYQLIDDEDGKAYTVYYFPEGNYLLGLADYFRTNNIPQGTSLTLDKKGPDQLTFWIKKSKKKTAIIYLEYDRDSGQFILSGQEVYTMAMPNKSIFLEKEVVSRLLALHEEVENLDLRQLLAKILTSPELTGNTRSLHFLRAYHMVDLLKPVTAEDVEYVLNAAPEFVASEKKEGMYFYQEVKVPEEAAVEEEARAEASLLSSLAEQLVSSEAAEAKAGEAEATTQAEVPVETEPVEVEVPSAGAEPEIQVHLEPLKKEKEKEKEKPVKKKAKVEEKGPKPKKSERRVIEEKIMEEESEIEALEAIKAQEEELEEAAEAGEEAIPVEIEVAKEEPKFGFFAEMLKSALSKKQPGQEEEEDKDKK